VETKKKIGELHIEELDGICTGNLLHQHI